MRQIFFFALKESDYNIMTISTFLGLYIPEDKKEEISMLNREVFKFKHTEVVAENYRSRGGMENHNALRNYGGTKPQISLKIALDNDLVVHLNLCFFHSMYRIECISGGSLFTQYR